MWVPLIDAGQPQGFAPTGQCFYCIPEISNADKINGGKALLKPIHLPSGKIIDLDKCLAIVPSATSPNSEVVLSGIEHHIQIDDRDVETLRQEIAKRRNREPKQLNLAETPAEKAEKVRKFNEIWNRMATNENAEEEAKIIMQIIDAERPSGQKLYSEE